MKEKILIAGGSGQVGKHLINYFLQLGYDVAVLSRNPKSTAAGNYFYWDTAQNKIDENCFNEVSHVIQLSGAGISEKRWTQKRKTEIVNSRVNSTHLLLETVKKNKVPLKTFISASAIGYYGALTNNKILNENDLPGNDFLANTCVQWEAAADKFASLGIRTVKIRTGIVLMQQGGALAKFMLPFNLGLGTAFGTGKQYFPWIHLADLCGIYHKAVSDANMQGAYNAVAPTCTTNLQLTSTLSKVLNRPNFLPNIPSLFFKLVFGEMASTILQGNCIAADKIINASYVFKYHNIEEALKNLTAKE